MAERELAEALEHRSGLLALAGTADMREVLGGRRGRRRRCRAWRCDVYTHRLRAGIAAMTAPLGGLDTLVFTGGVGERRGSGPELVVEAREDLEIARQVRAVVCR